MNKRYQPTLPLLSLVLCMAVVTTPNRAFAADAEAPTPGQQVYDKACAKCHNSGPGAFFTGAPRIGTDYWKKRLSTAGSVDVLVTSVMKGKGKMPAQGGSSGLSDADLKAAVEYMLSRTKS